MTAVDELSATLGPELFASWRWLVSGTPAAHHERHAEALLEKDEAPAAFLQQVMEAVHQFQGVTDSTMSHDDAWRFLILGQSLERVDMTARLLLARMAAAPSDSGCCR